MRLLDLGVQALKFNLWLSIVSLKITVHCRTGRWRSQTLSVCVRPTRPDCSQKSRDPCERWPTVLYGWTISERHLTFWLCRLSYQTVGRMEGMLALGFVLGQQNRTFSGLIRLSLNLQTEHKEMFNTSVVLQKRALPEMMLSWLKSSHSQRFDETLLIMWGVIKENLSFKTSVPL